MFHNRTHKRLPLTRVPKQANLYTRYLSYLFLSSLSVLFSCLPQGIQNVPYDIRNETCGRRCYNSCNINTIFANLIGDGLFVSLILQQWVWKVWRYLTVTSCPGIESWWGRCFPYPTRPLGPLSLLYKRYRIFIGNKTPGRSDDHPSTSERSCKSVGGIPLPPPHPHPLCACKGTSSHLLMKPHCPWELWNFL